MQRDYKYLVKVDDKSNINKFYEITKDGNMLVVNSGRVGGKLRSQRFPVGKWSELYRTKIIEGYEDVTKYHLTEIKTKKVDENWDADKYAPIKDEKVRDLIERLLEYAKKTIEESYIVGLRDVSPKMIEQAEKIITKIDKLSQRFLTNTEDEELLIDDFNEYLQRLFSILPRKMGDVKNYLMDDKEQYGEILEREYQLLDTLKSQLLLQNSSVQREDRTILEKFSLKIREVTQEEYHRDIEPMLGDKKHMYSRAFRVDNELTSAEYNNWCTSHKITNQKLLWHGSGNNAWWSILSGGLSLSYAAYGMFGKGLYFSNDADKSMGYTSILGSRWRGGSENLSYMGIFETAYGNPVKTQDWDSSCYRFDTETFFQKYPHNDCYHALSGDNLRKDEIIFYMEPQVTIKYLVEFKN